MPSNEINVKLQVSDSAALTKVAEAMGNAGTNVSARVGGGNEYQTMAQAVGALKDIQAQLGRGQQLTGGTVRETAGGGFQASGTVEQRKAFGPGGYLAGVATAVGGIFIGFKKLLDMSSVLNTFMSTTGKILATAVDLMLAPLMPIFTKIMVWIIQTVFPIATKLGDWLGGMGTGGAATVLAAGYVGLKITQGVLETAGKTIASFIGSAMPTETIGTAISMAFSAAKSNLKDWGDTAALYIMEGFDAAASTLDAWYKTVAGGVMDAFSSATSTISSWYKTVAGGIMDAFSTASSTIGTWYTTVADGVLGAMNTIGTKLDTMYTTVSTGILGAMNTSKTKLGTWFTAISDGVSAAMVTGKEKFMAIGGFIADGVRGLGSWFTEKGRAIGNAISGAVGGINWKSMGGLIGAGIGVAAIGAAIGYAMWKTYKEYEKGKDVTAGLSRMEQVSMFQAEFGMGETEAASLVEDIGKYDISTTFSGLQDYIKTINDIKKQMELFGSVVRPEGLSGIQPGEMKAFADKVRSGDIVFGKAAADWSPDSIADWLMDLQKEAGFEASLMGDINDVPNIRTTPDLLATMPSGFMANTAKAFVDPVIERQMNNLIQSEFRKMLENVIPGISDKHLWGVGPYKTEELTQQQSELGFLLSAAQGANVSSFLTRDFMDQFQGGDRRWTQEELSNQLAGGNFTINFTNERGAEFGFSPRDLEGIKNALIDGLMLEGFTMTPGN